MASLDATFSDIVGQASNIGGAVQGVFAGIGAEQQGALQAEGLQITAQGTLITAQGTQINAEALGLKAEGDLAEASNYDIAAQLAQANAAYADQSTRIQVAQEARQVAGTIGSQRASVAASGFSSGGSAGDLMRDSAAQGALARGVLEQQGVITEAGYNEQAQSCQTLAATGRATAAVEQQMETQTENIATEQQWIATQQRQLAMQTQQAADTAATGDFISSALKGVAAVAGIVLAPATGGASLAVGADAAAALTGTGGLY
jgi:hypothetical protein